MTSNTVVIDLWVFKAGDDVINECSVWEIILSSVQIQIQVMN